MIARRVLLALAIVVLLASAPVAAPAARHLMLISVDGLRPELYLD